MALRTNYKDDVFTGKRKYNMTTNGDGSVSFTDVTEYSQTGDTYGAAQINDANTIINDLDSNAFRKSDGAETAIADNDYFPYFDTSANAKKKSLWSNIVNVLKNTFAIKVHDSTSAGTYGAGTGDRYGHVKLSDSYTQGAGTASQSVGASSQAVYDAYRNRAPINHAATTTTYGVGTGTHFGHLKISDGYTTSSGTAAEGVAASGKAVNDVYNAATNAATSAYNNAKTYADGVANTAYTNANNNSVTRYNEIVNELKANNLRIYMDYKNGKYGINTSANRGADTFIPFKTVDGSLAINVNCGCDLTVNQDESQRYHAYGSAYGTITINGISLGIPSSTCTVQGYGNQSNSTHSPADFTLSQFGID